MEFGRRNSHKCQRKYHIRKNNDNGCPNFLFKSKIQSTVSGYMFITHLKVPTPNEGTATVHLKLSSHLKLESKANTLHCKWENYKSRSCIHGKKQAFGTLSETGHCGLTVWSWFTGETDTNEFPLSLWRRTNERKKTFEGESTTELLHWR